MTGHFRGVLRPVKNYLALDKSKGCGTAKTVPHTLNGPLFFSQSLVAKCGLQGAHTGRNKIMVLDKEHYFEKYFNPECSCFIVELDSKISKLLSEVCDIEFLDEGTQPQDEGGHLEYNISGQTFAIRSDGSEYILLADKTIGYWTADGYVGRIADSLYDFIELIANCPHWDDYAFCRFNGVPPIQIYKDKALLEGFIAKNGARLNDYLLGQVDMNADRCRQLLTEALNVSLYTHDNIIEVVTKFYNSATRQPNFAAIYTEDDGSQHPTSGTVLSDICD